MVSKNNLKWYIKMEHKTSWMEKLMNERQKEKSCPVQIEQLYQSDTILLAMFGRPAVYFSGKERTK